MFHWDRKDVCLVFTDKMIIVPQWHVFEKLFLVILYKIRSCKAVQLLMRLPYLAVCPPGIEFLCGCFCSVFVTAFFFVLYSNIEMLSFNSFRL